MKLKITEAEAFIYSAIVASFFVLSVYIWKPLVTPPAEVKQLWLRKRHNLKPYEVKAIEDYEIGMRIKSVGSLVLLAMSLLVFRSHLSERPDVGILRWFGLTLDLQTLQQTCLVLLLNSLLFAGEIWQIMRGTAQV